MLPIRIRDARDQPCPLYEPARKRLIAAGADRGGTGLGVVTEATGRKARVQSGTGALSAQIGYSIALVFISLIAFFNFRRGSYGVGVFMLCLLAYTFFELFIKRWYRRWRHKEQILRALNALGRCGSCGYELMGIDPQGDGCLVCPECGAAWRADKRRADDAPRWIRPKPWRRVYVSDDRGWRCRPNFASHMSFDGLNYQRYKLLLKRSGPAGWLAKACVLIAVILFTAGMVFAAVRHDERFAIGVLVATLAFLIVHSLLVSLSLSLRREVMRLGLLEHGFCVCCNDSLPDKPEPDNRRVCQTCGSAWLIP